jgi:hypothetical protein
MDPASILAAVGLASEAIAAGQKIIQMVQTAHQQSAWTAEQQAMLDAEVAAAKARWASLAPVA